MSGRVLRWVWEWWQAPATEPKRNRWHSQRETSVTAPRRSGLGFFGWGGCLESHDAWRTGLGFAPHQARFLRARGAGVLASARARCGAGVGRRCGRAFRVASGAGRRGLSRRASRLRHAPPAGAPDPRARCYHLRQIWGSTLGTVVPEVVAARVRRALVATRRRPPYAVDSAIDVRQPSHGVHAFGAAQLSHAHLIQECALCEDDLSRRPARAGVYPGRARKAVIYSYSQALSCSMIYTYE